MVQGKTTMECLGDASEAGLTLCCVPGHEVSSVPFTSVSPPCFLLLWWLPRRLFHFLCVSLHHIDTLYMGNNNRCNGLPFPKWPVQKEDRVGVSSRLFGMSHVVGLLVLTQSCRLCNTRLGRARASGDVKPDRYSKSTLDARAAPVCGLRVDVAWAHGYRALEWEEAAGTLASVTRGSWVTSPRRPVRPGKSYWGETLLPSLQRQRDVFTSISEVRPYLLPLNSSRTCSLPWSEVRLLEDTRLF